MHAMQVMLPYNHTEFINIVKSHVDEKRIHMSRINDAVERILRVKFSLGLFETPMADYSFVDKLGHQRHRDLAREAVRKSLVLLKNSNDTNTGTPLLPLPKNATKILVAGAHGNNLALQCGGWTISWNGMVSKNITIGTTILATSIFLYCIFFCTDLTRVKNISNTCSKSLKKKSY